MPEVRPEYTEGEQPQLPYVLAGLPGEVVIECEDGEPASDDPVEIRTNIIGQDYTNSEEVPASADEVIPHSAPAEPVPLKNSDDSSEPVSLEKVRTDGCLTPIAETAATALPNEAEATLGVTHEQDSIETSEVAAPEPANALPASESGKNPRVLEAFAMVERRVAARGPLPPLPEFKFYEYEGEDPATAAHRQEMRQEVRRNAHGIARQMSHDELFDLPKINAFFENHGLRTTPAAILLPEQLPEFKARLTEIGFPGEHLDSMEQNGDARGICLHGLDLTIAVKLRNLSPAGEKLFEYVVTHEKAHSTGRYAGRWEAMPRQFWEERDPNDQRRLGEFWEEGFADLMAGHYVRTRLGMPNGAWSEAPAESPNERFASQAPNSNLVPNVYIWPRSDGGVYVSKGGYAAHGLELLIAAEPTLLMSCIKSRSSTTALLEFAETVNEIRPGLYAELNVLQKNTTQKDVDGFRRGLKLIREAVGADNDSWRWY